MQPLSFELARKTVKHYACSICWGELESAPDAENAGMYQVACKNCKEETKGYVTQYYVNRRRGESEFEKVNAEHMLRRLRVIDNPLAGMSKADIVKELGF